MKMYTISFLYVKIIIMPETICLINHIFMLDFVNIDANLLCGSGPPPPPPPPLLPPPPPHPPPPPPPPPPRCLTLESGVSVSLMVKQVKKWQAWSILKRVTTKHYNYGAVAEVWWSFRPLGALDHIQAWIGLPMYLGISTVVVSRKDVMLLKRLWDLVSKIIDLFLWK